MLRKTLLCVLLLGYFHAANAQYDNLVNKIQRKNYSFSFLSSWSLDTTNRGSIDFLLLAPVNDASLGFRENINLLMQDYTTIGMTLEKYKSLTEEQIKNMPDFELIESKLEKGDIDTIYILKSSFKMDNRQLKSSAICLMRNNVTYLVTYTAEQAYFELYVKEAEVILRSFKLL